MNSRMVKLGELTRIRTGKLDANAQDEDGLYPFFTCAVENLKINDYAYDCECVLVAGNGDLNVKYYSGKFNAYQRTYIIESKNKQTLDVRYLYHFMSIHVDILRHQSIGGVIKYIKLGNLTDALIPLPSLEQQQKIAAVLDAVDSLLSKRREGLKKLEVLLKSVFLEMFGDPVTNPKGWKVLSFSEVCDCRLGKMLDAKQQTGKNKRQYLRNANVQWNRFELGDLLEMDFDEKDRKEFALLDGDLLICEGGEVGRTAIWRNQLSDCYFQKALHRGRPKLNLVTSEFLLYFLWIMAGNGGLSDFTTVATIAHLTGEKLRKVPTPLPPLELQKKFSETIKNIEISKNNVAQSLSSLEKLFASLQHQAFNGTLTAAVLEREVLKLEEVQAVLF